MCVNQTPVVTVVLFAHVMFVAYVMFVAGFLTETAHTTPSKPETNPRQFQPRRASWKQNSRQFQPRRCGKGHKCQIPKKKFQPT